MAEEGRRRDVEREVSRVVRMAWKLSVRVVRRGREVCKRGGCRE